jgi:cobalt/nickel transport system permease protein
MHIPDGYLSPSTCAALYAASAPFWYTALRRLARQVAGRLIPLVAVFSAFSFVVMMFNLPLPGGTTGHAAGIAVAAIVLGPWASILAVSAALLIQALFFGDGGVTALGANCFNMAIVGCLTAYAVYRFAAGRSPLDSRRRVAAAGLAGYVSINAAALLAALEFGIQPVLFTDSAGAPLYAPYRLAVAVPAMMIGHLTVAGAAELILTAGLVAWLQKSHPSLLAATAPGAPRAAAEPAPAPGWRALRPFLAGLAAVLLLTPLGILAVGAAWGEWAPEDFADAAARRQIAAASRGQAPPSRAPEGLERLSAIWTAPMPGYAPAVLRSAAAGYVLSGAFGTGVILGGALLADWALRARRRRAA